MQRVVVTGLGVIGPTGLGAETLWTRLCDGPTAIGAVTRFDARGYRCGIAGEVPDALLDAALPDGPRRKRAHVTRLALVAGRLALEDAGLATSWERPDRVGTALGTALGGWRDGEQQLDRIGARGARHVNPFVANGAAPHAAGAELANSLGACGPQLTFANGCPAGLEALGRGAALVASGELDVCLAGGAESPICRVTFAGMGRTHELARVDGSPAEASCPFDARHTGLVPSEGAAVLVLETAEHAARRGATPYGVLLGFASSCDAAGLYGLDQTGETGARAIGEAFRRAGRRPAEVDWVCAHANSSPAFDRKEARVLARALGENTPNIPVSSIKGVLGHPFAAAGAFQTVAALLALRRGTIPPTHNLETADAECSLAHVVGRPLTAGVGTVLVTSYGYGGLNAYLVVGAA